MKLVEYVYAVNENTRIRIDFQAFPPTLRFFFSFLFACFPFASFLIHTSAHVFISLLALGQVLPYFNLAFPHFL